MDIAVDVVCAYLSAWHEIFANHKYNQTTQHNKGDNATQRTLTRAQAANNLNPISHGRATGPLVELSTNLHEVSELCPEKAPTYERLLELHKDHN